MTQDTHWNMPKEFHKPDCWACKRERDYKPFEYVWFAWYPVKLWRMTNCGYWETTGRRAWLRDVMVVKLVWGTCLYKTLDILEVRRKAAP